MMRTSILHKSKQALYKCAVFNTCIVNPILKLLGIFTEHSRLRKQGKKSEKMAMGEKKSLQGTATKRRHEPGERARKARKAPRD